MTVKQLHLVSMFTIRLIAARFADAMIVVHILISMIVVSFAVTILNMPHAGCS